MPVRYWSFTSLLSMLCTRKVTADCLAAMVTVAGRLSRLPALLPVSAMVKVSAIDQSPERVRVTLWLLPSSSRMRLSLRKRRFSSSMLLDEKAVLLP